MFKINNFFVVKFSFQSKLITYFFIFSKFSSIYKFQVKAGHFGLNLKSQFRFGSGSGQTRNENSGSGQVRVE